MNLQEHTNAVDILTRESSLLHASLFKSKSLPTASQVNETILERDRFRRKIKEYDLVLKKTGDTLRKAIADVQSLRSVLSLCDDDQKLDTKELDDLRWGLIHAEKQATMPFPKP